MNIRVTLKSGHYFDVKADECLFSTERVHTGPDATDSEDREMAAFTLEGEKTGWAFMRDVEKLIFLP